MILIYVYLREIADKSGNQADVDAMGFLVSVGVALMLFAIPMAVLGGFWLYYCNRSSVKRLFANVDVEA